MTVCRDLLGMQLCRRETGGKVNRLLITEVEAYDGTEDKASHAHRGMTPRNRIMFGPGGYWYVYLCYGIHWLLNIVAGPEDHPAAILIRGAGTIQGPGRLTKALKIDRRFNGRPASVDSGLWIEPRIHPLKRASIIRSPRVGIDSAGYPWTEKPWRYLWMDAPDIKLKV